MSKIQYICTRINELKDKNLVEDSGNIQLKCPYCDCDLIEGFIDSPECSLRWHNKDVGFLERYTVFGGEILCNHNSDLIKCYRCKNCNKLIINLDELDKWE